MPSIDPQAMYPPSPSMGGIPRENPHRDVGAAPNYGRTGPPPSHSYPHQLPWMQSNGPYGHHVHGAPPPHAYHPQHIGSGGPEAPKQHGPPGAPPPTGTPHYPAHGSQHYSVGPPGAYHIQHQPPGPPPAYGGPPPPHLYPFRPGPWGYGMPGYDQQTPQRHGFSSQHSQQSHVPLPQPTQHRQQNQVQPQSPSPHPPLGAQHQKQEQHDRTQQGNPKKPLPETETLPPPQQPQKPSQQHTAPKSTSFSGSVFSKATEGTKTSSVESKPLSSKAGSTDDFELDRTKANAAEFSLAEVKPIQSDFHFFVHEMSPSFRPAAEAEVSRAIALHKASIEANTVKYRYLVNSNLNCRLLRAWEDLTMDERTEFMKKEEEDRRRFMDEDEVTSRHCFTLTARVRSPNKNKLQSPKGAEPDYDQEDVSETKNVHKNDTENEKHHCDTAQSPIGIIKGNSTSTKDIFFTVSPKSHDGAKSEKHSNESGVTTFIAENVVTPPTKKEDNEDVDNGSSRPCESDRLIATPDKAIGVSRTTQIVTDSKDRDGAQVFGDTNIKPERQSGESEAGDAKRSQDKISRKEEKMPQKKNRSGDH